MRQFHAEGGLTAYHERMARLHTPPAPHDPRPLPAPPPAHYARLAVSKRREAASILRHVPTQANDLHARFARKQARALLDEADGYEALASAGGAS